jgi:predicted nucleic acid-binding protein
VNEDLICLDTTIWIKSLTREEPRDEGAAARRLVLRTVASAQVIAPAWAWAEVATVLRKKVRMRLLRAEQAEEFWLEFSPFPIDFIDSPELRTRAWEIAAQFDLPTLYDASFLACTEVVPIEGGGAREFWTADRVLIRQLGTARPAYVRLLTA